MTAPPPVTIGLPVYNGADYLDAALASLHTQSFTDFVVIASDNASTDATPDILAAWARRDPRIRPHRQTENIGMVANFAFVRAAAESPWFLQAAHDDTWSPNYVQALFAAARANPDALLIAPQVVKTHPDGREDRRTRVPDALARARGRARVRLLLRRAQSGWVYGLFDRAALIAAQAPTERFGWTWGHEFITLLPMILAGRVAGANEAIYYQRQTGLSGGRYKPRTRKDQAALRAAFWRTALGLLAQAPLAAPDRALLLPALNVYTSAHAWKIRRLAKSWALRRP